LNALKSGATAKTRVLPWEDPALFDEHLEGYRVSIQPDNPLEHDLVEQLAMARWQRDRAWRSDLARVTSNIHTSRVEQLRRADDEAAALGQRLFFDQHGPLPLHPRGRNDMNWPRTVWSKSADDPDHPSRLVMALEDTWAGVRWLLARWTELRDRLEGGDCWHAPEKVKCVRLLGKLPYDAADEREVALVYLSCHVIEPRHDDPFIEILSDMEVDDYKRIRDRLARRNVESMRPLDPAAARALLLDLADRKIERLNQLADDRLAFDDRMNALNPDIMGFDGSVEGERLRRHASTCDRAWHRAISTLVKIRRDLPLPDFDPTGDDGEPPEIGDAAPETESHEPDRGHPRAEQNGHPFTRERQHAIEAAGPLGDGHPARQETELLGDGHLARHGPDATRSSGDEHLAGQKPMLPAGKMPAPLECEIPAGKMPAPLKTELAAGKMPAPLECEIPAGKMPAPRAPESMGDGHPARRETQSSVTTNTHPDHQLTPDASSLPDTIDPDLQNKATDQIDDPQIELPQSVEDRPDCPAAHPNRDEQTANNLEQQPHLPDQHCSPSEEPATEPSNTPREDRNQMLHDLLSSTLWTHRRSVQKARNDRGTDLRTRAEREYAALLVDLKRVVNMAAPNRIFRNGTYSPKPTGRPRTPRATPTRPPPSETAPQQSTTAHRSG
jgi:hypothetical protein